MRWQRGIQVQLLQILADENRLTGFFVVVRALMFLTQSLQAVNRNTGLHFRWEDWT